MTIIDVWPSLKINFIEVIPKMKIWVGKFKVPLNFFCLLKVGILAKKTGKIYI